MLHDPSSHYWQFSLRKHGDQSSVLTTISNKDDKITFMDAAYKTKEGWASFGYIMKLNGDIVGTGAIQGLKIDSAKEAEAKAILAALDKVRKNGFVRLRILMDEKEVVQGLNGEYDWSINPIILDIKC